MALRIPDVEMEMDKFLAKADSKLRPAFLPRLTQNRATALRYAALRDASAAGGGIIGGLASLPLGANPAVAVFVGAIVGTGAADVASDVVSPRIDERLTPEEKAEREKHYALLPELWTLVHVFQGVR